MGSFGDRKSSNTSAKGKGRGDDGEEGEIQRER